MFPLRLAVLAAMLTSLAAGDGSSVALRISLIGDNAAFRMGQTIPIAFDYTTQSQQALGVNADVRLHCIFDSILATPAEGAINLRKPEPRWECPMPGVGWEGTKIDSIHPLHIELDLNQFVEFRQPGHYRIHAVSDRVPAYPQIQSNELALTILPRDEAQDAATFQFARATLEAGKPPKEPQRISYPDKENQQIDAVRILRYLDTENAAAYLASLFGEPGRSEEEIEDALYASQYRDTVIATLKQRLRDPELAIGQDFEITLLELERSALAQKQGHPLSGPESNALFESVEQGIFEAAVSKTPQARADTYYFLFVTGSPSLQTNPTVKQKLIAGLTDASGYVLDSMFTTFWDRISDVGPALIPLLRQTAVRRSESWQLHPAGAALHRLEQLDSAGAQSIALNDILTGDSLELDPQLVQLSLPPSHAIDAALVEQYVDGKPVDVRIARFASANAEPELWRAFDAKIASQPTVCPTPLFAYFFRVDPKAAAERLATIRHAAASCRELQLNGFENWLMSPGLENQLVTDALSGDNALWRSALQTLSDGGSKRVLSVLVETLGSEPLARKREQIHAILYGRNWFLSEQDLLLLDKECAGTNICPDVQNVERQYRRPYRLSVSLGTPQDGFTLCGHAIDNLRALENAISDFPAHSAFHWEQVHNPITPDEMTQHKEASQALQKHGMVLLD